MELDRAVNAGSQRPVGIGDVDFSQQRPRARLQRIGAGTDQIMNEVIAKRLGITG